MGDATGGRAEQEDFEALTPINSWPAPLQFAFHLGSS
jgi:hypothetical protein